MSPPCPPLVPVPYGKGKGSAVRQGQTGNAPQPVQAKGESLVPYGKTMQGKGDINLLSFSACHEPYDKAHGYYKRYTSEQSSNKPRFTLKRIEGFSDHLIAEHDKTSSIKNSICTVKTFEKYNKFYLYTEKQNFNLNYSCVPKPYGKCKVINNHSEVHHSDLVNYGIDEIIKKVNKNMY